MTKGNAMIMRDKSGKLSTHSEGVQTDRLVIALSWNISTRRDWIKMAEATFH
jgi:hypothetical protein